MPPFGQRPSSLLLLDVVAVGAFVAVGRRTHDEGNAVVGLLATAWPFLVGVGAGWLVARAWRRPTVLLPTGVVVWLGAAGGGLALRGLAGGGLAASFVVVATLVLAVLLLGWRGAAGVLHRTSLLRHDRASS